MDVPPQENKPIVRTDVAAKDVGSAVAGALGGLVLLGITAGWAMIHFGALKGYQLNRFRAFVNPANAPQGRGGQGVIAMKTDGDRGRLAGVRVVKPDLHELVIVSNFGTTIRIDAEDGTRVERGTSVLFLSGHARALLSAERVALNFMQRLSGIATLTRQFVDAVPDGPVPFHYPAPALEKEFG